MDALAPAARAKIRPFGLNFACGGKRLAARVLARLGAGHASAIARAAFFDRPRFKEDLNALKQFVTLPPAAEFEARPDTPVEPLVLFQTRVWEAEEVFPDDPAAVNEPRVALVLALRKAFGPRFRGGLVPTEYARRHYPDAVTDLASRRADYVAMSRSALVGVYTRGLHHSTAFKLPEYLASSKAVVAEPVRNALPTPLEDGRHYLGFETPDECVARCERLLTDNRLAADMRAENWRYYREEAEPGAHVVKILERVFE